GTAMVGVPCGVWALPAVSLRRRKNVTAPPATTTSRTAMTTNDDRPVFRWVARATRPPGYAGSLPASRGVGARAGYRTCPDMSGERGSRSRVRRPRDRRARDAAACVLASRDGAPGPPRGSPRRLRSFVPSRDVAQNGRGAVSDGRSVPVRGGDDVHARGRSLPRVRAEELVARGRLAAPFRARVPPRRGRGSGRARARASARQRGGLHGEALRRVRGTAGVGARLGHPGAHADGRPGHRDRSPTGSA